MCVAVKCLTVELWPGGRDLLKKRDVVGIVEQREHLGKLHRMACGRQSSFVIGECIVNGAQATTRGRCVEIPARLDVAPKSDDVSVVPVRTGIDPVTRRHNGRAAVRGV